LSEDDIAPDNSEIQQALGAFILALASLEATLIMAIASIVGVAPGTVGYLLGSVNGRNKGDLLKNAFKDKGLEVDPELRKALSKIHHYMNTRNRVVHDPIVFHANRGRWARLQGKLVDDAERGFEKQHLDPVVLNRDAQSIWKIIKIIGEKVLIPYGEFRYD